MIKEQTNTRLLTYNAILAGIYIILTTLNPIGWGVLQLRISTMILPIGYLNKKLAPGIIIGVLISNLFSPFGFINVLAGAIIHLVIYYVVSSIAKNIYITSFIYSIWAGLILALMFNYVMNAPILISFISTSISNLIIVMIGATICDRILSKYI